jgi:DnaJ family protein C protein 13
LLKESGGQVLATLLQRCVSIVGVHTERTDVVVQTMEHCIQVFAGLGALANGREACAQLPGTPISMVADIVRAIQYEQAPMVVKYALEAAARFSVDATLQYHLLTAGALWMLLPLLFKYDSTVDVDEADVETNAQAAANMMAIKAANVLSRLAGHHPGFPCNALAIRALGLTITPSLGQMLAHADDSDQKEVKAMLSILSTSSTTPYRYWTSGMREELVAYVDARMEMARCADNWCAEPALDFQFDTLKHEVVVGEIYVRVYNEKCVHAAPRIDDPQSFARALLEFIEVAVDRLVVAVDKKGSTEALWTYREFAGSEQEAQQARVDAIGGDPYERGAGEEPREISEGKGNVKQLCMCLAALKNLIDSNPGVEEECASRHLPLLFQLLAPGALFEDPHPALRDAAIAVITAMSRNVACAAAIAEERLLVPLFRLLRSSIGVRKQVLRVIVSLCETRAVVNEVMRVWGMLELMRVLVGMGGLMAEQGEKKTSTALTKSAATVEDIDDHGRTALTDEAIDDVLEERKTSALVLSRMLQDRVMGPKMFIIVQRFLPLSIARELRESPEDVVLTLDKTHETPEIVWDSTCRRDLKSALAKACQQSDEAAALDGVWKPPGGHEKYRVKYTILDGEVMVGGVYLRIFLKDPTFPLRDPKAFLESMLRLLSVEAETVVTTTKTSDSTTRDALMTALTSSTVCLFKVNPRLMSHMATLGYVPKIVKLLKAAPIPTSEVGINIAAVCFVRLLHQIATDSTCMEQFARTPVTECLFRVARPVHADTAYVLEALLKVVRGGSHFIGRLMEVDNGTIITFLIGVLEDAEDLSVLRDVVAAKFNAVEILKVLENDPIHGEAVIEGLGAFAEAWERYKYQKHDLFLVRTEQQDYFLTDTPDSFLSLEDGSAKSAVSTADATT